MGHSYRHVLLIATLQIISCWQAASAVPQTIEGRVTWPESITRASKIKLVMNLENGRKLFAWPKADGGFTFHGVPEGTHLLDVNAIGLIYPQIRLEVNAIYPGSALVSYAEQAATILPPPFVVQPTGPAEYFEKHEPFNLISFIKTPYGLMAAFGIFALVVLPRIKMDPEDLKEARESLAGKSSTEGPSTPTAIRAPPPIRTRAAK